jgi:plastocyanin
VQTVQLYLDSHDDIHAFYVPEFLFKRDVVPGRVNVFDFKVNADDAGQTFHGQCAELCGAGHRVMLFDVHALAPAEFQTWLQGKIAGGSATPPPAGSPEPGASAVPGSAAPGEPVGDTVVQIGAEGIAFDVSEVTVPANEGFRIEFDNRDANVPHNVAVHEGSPTGPEIWQGEIFSGPDQRTYEVPALAAGTYGFICTVHPNMTGTLTAE